MPDEILYQVDYSGNLREYEVLLGAGSYVNLREVGSSTELNMVNRAQFRASPSLAWLRKSDELDQQVMQARDFAVKSIRHWYALRRIKTKYTRKEEDLVEAEASVMRWLRSIYNLRIRSADAFERSKE